MVAERRPGEPADGPRAGSGAARGIGRFGATCALLAGLVAAGPVTATEPLLVEEVLFHPGQVPERPALQIDPLALQLARGEFVFPSGPGEGWSSARADGDGWITHESLPGAWAFAELEVAEGGTWILEGMGYAGVYVNGEPRIGNVYGYTDAWEAWQPAFDFSFVPVRLAAGSNRLLFFGNRYGLMRARLHAATSPLALNARDATLPDLVAGEAVDAPGSIVVLNATGDVVRDAVLVAELAGGEVVESAVGVLAPWGLRKAQLRIRGPAPAPGGPRTLRIQLRRGEEILDEASLELQVRAPHDNRRVTFVSELDGSVQYYGFLPATDPGPSRALVLSLHGAAVEAINQSGSYAPLPWADLVAPTNRRPFGFSWEDWGRLDALEVLQIARERLRPDPSRIYLTGHSMGGHGSWHLATLYPDRFAAVGPSAGWITLWSYRMDPPASPPSPVAALVERATLPSRTLEMAPNLVDMGVYVLHGDADDNVPVDQAYLMLDRLGGFHRDFEFHEEPGAGHWWDRSPDPGADCVAWPPMFDFFARHRRPAPAERSAIRFRTPSPSVSAWHAWAGVIAQQRGFAMSTLDLRRDPTASLVRGTTGNVALLALDFRDAAGDSVTVELDGVELRAATPADGILRLERGVTWAVSGAPDASRKGPHRAGGFREAFARRVQLVHATGGTAEENAWALARARYDAELLWYQGNSSIDVVADTDFEPALEPDRNVILYGNADTHRNWEALWTGQVEVRRDRVVVGDRTLAGSTLGVLAVRPRPGSDEAVIGIVAPTGAAGARILDLRPVLTPGVAYPDLTVFDARQDDEIVIGAGFFGPDWSVATGEFAWADPE